MKNQAQQQQQQQISNPWDTDSESEDEQEEQTNFKVVRPYEEQQDKFNRWYNEFFVKATQFSESKYINEGLPDFNVLHINNQTFHLKSGLFDSLKSNDPVFNKTVASFVYLDNEVKAIKEMFEDKLFDALILYGDRGTDVEEDDLKEGIAEVEFSRLLNVPKKLFDMMKRLSSIMFNIINQLNTLYNKKMDFFRIYKNIDLLFPLDTIGTAIQLFYTLDRIVDENQNILDHINNYKKMLNIVKTEPEKFGQSSSTVKSISRQLEKLCATVLSSAALQTILNQSWDMNAQNAQVSSSNQTKVLINKNKDLQELFRNYFKIRLQQIMDKVGTDEELNERKMIFPLLGVYAFFRKLWPQDEERDVYKNLWGIQKKIPCVPGHRNNLLIIYKFLQNISPLNKASSNLEPKQPIENIQQYLKTLEQTLDSQINSVYGRFCTWISRMESVLTSNQISEEFLKQTQKQGQTLKQRLEIRKNLIVSGLQFQTIIKNHLEMLFLLSYLVDKQVPDQLIKPIRLGFEIIKIVKYMLNQKPEAFNPYTLLKPIVKSLISLYNKKIEIFQKQDQGQKKPEKQEIIAALRISCLILQTPINFGKINILYFVTNVISQKSLLQPNEIEQIRILIRQIHLLSQYQLFAHQQSDCSFIYHASEKIPIIFKSVYDNPRSAKRLPFLVQIFDDCEPYLKNALHLSQKDFIFESFKRYVLKEFNKEFLQKTTSAIEDFLRLNIHTMLIEKIVGHNPYDHRVKELNRILDLGRLTILDQQIDIKDEIRQTLNENFYNINVINMHDMETYEQMRTLANYIFDLNLMHVYIPSQTIDQGKVDILNIIKNIPNFVQKYAYNAFQQQFVEITGESKVIISIGIQQISDSIRTHGLGILNSTVNLALSFIKSKFSIFSQFLYDDKIQSCLRREENYFKENKEKLEGKYPFEHAEKLYKDIKKFGQFSDGRTYMDQFRQLITEVGNALGFVRLLRSASLNFCSKSIEFLPFQQEEDQVIFVELAKQGGFGQSSTDAAEELDEIFEFLKNSFSSRSDFLKLFVKIIQKSISQQDKKAVKHLKLFPIIIPALTLNYVEQIMLAKDRLKQNNPFNAYISDDGFIMGISYFLGALDQTKNFEQLHWYEEVMEYYKKKLDDLKAAEKSSSAKNQRIQDDHETQRGLSQRKLNLQIEEYTLFFNAFTSTRIFFRDLKTSSEQ